LTLDTVSETKVDPVCLPAALFYAVSGAAHGRRIRNSNFQINRMKKCL